MTVSNKKKGFKIYALQLREIEEVHQPLEILFVNTNPYISLVH